MLWCNVFQLIISIHQIEALLEGINFHISGFEIFPAVSKLLKHSPSTFSKWKKTLQFSALQVFLSKYNLIMPTIPKLSWKYCRSPKTEFLFVFLFFIYFFFFFNLFISGKPSTFSRVLLFIRLWEREKIWPGCLPVHLVQSIKTSPSLRHTSVWIY